MGQQLTESEIFLMRYNLVCSDANEALFFHLRNVCSAAICHLHTFVNYFVNCRCKRVKDVSNSRRDTHSYLNNRRAHLY